jgi:hypothetical protein
MTESAPSDAIAQVPLSRDDSFPEEILFNTDPIYATHAIIEKDYILGWVLRGIYRHPQVQNIWIFKGGTSLKKCFLRIIGSPKI